MKQIGLFIFMVSVFFSRQLFAAEDIIKMYGKDVNGYNQPRYYLNAAAYDWKDRFDIVAIANPDNFPWSSREQGTVFVKIFDDLAQKEHIVVKFYYPHTEYQQSVNNFEKGKIGFMSGANTIFGLYYENIPFSKNQYIYPAFFENGVHIITPAEKSLNIKSKDDLKNYRGAYAGDDYFSSFVLNDFKSIGIKKAESFVAVYKQLLTGEVDYVVASYYPSQIELYKLGIRDYVVYSKEPVWKMPMFFRGGADFVQHPRLNYLKKYLKSTHYKKVRDDALRELLDIYRENTRGIVPPTYINQAPATKTKESVAPKAEDQSQEVISKDVMPLSANK